MYDTFNISILCIYAQYLSDTLLSLLLNKGLLDEYTEVWSESVKQLARVKEIQGLIPDSDDTNTVKRCHGSESPTLQDVNN